MILKNNLQMYLCVSTDVFFCSCFRMHVVCAQSPNTAKALKHKPTLICIPKAEHTRTHTSLDPMQGSPKGHIKKIWVVLWHRGEQRGAELFNKCKKKKKKRSSSMGDGGIKSKGVHYYFKHWQIYFQSSHAFNSYYVLKACCIPPAL